MIKKNLARAINILFPLTAITILLLSLLPTIKVSSIETPFLDKFLHIIAYCILGILGFLFFYVKKPHKGWGVVFSVLTCTGWGIIIELLQSYTGRTPELLDGVVNFIGCQIGACFAMIIQKKGD
ncbi:MAG: VanZ family protein [Spirochaetales bacterium]|nr:VanZ family protein [Spirochaetales bacterium]